MIVPFSVLGGFGVSGLVNEGVRGDELLENLGLRGLSLGYRGRDLRGLRTVRCK